MQIAELEEGGEIILRARDHGRPGGGLHRSGGVVCYIEGSMGESRKVRRLQWEQWKLLERQFEQDSRVDVVLQQNDGSERFLVPHVAAANLWGVTDGAGDGELGS